MRLGRSFVIIAAFEKLKSRSNEFFRTKKKKKGDENVYGKIQRKLKKEERFYR